MDLRRWLIGNRVTQRKFAKDMGVSTNTIQCWIKKRILPRAFLCAAIERYTSGLVTIKDLLSKEAEEKLMKIVPINEQIW